MFRNSKNKETDVDTVVEAESKYSLFNLSTFAGRKSNYKAKLSIEYTLCKCLAKFLTSQQNCALYIPYGAD